MRVNFFCVFPKWKHSSDYLSYAPLLILVFFQFISPIVYADDFQKVYDMVYINYTLDSYCIKRLNGTHEFGCGVPPHVKNKGALHLVSNQTELDYVTRTGSHEPYVALLEDEMFTKHVLVSLRDSRRVAGILLLHNKSYMPATFSGEKQCPGQIRGLYTDGGTYDDCKTSSGVVQPWNPDGSSLLYEKFDFPIGLVENETVIAALKECYDQHNRHSRSGAPPDYPLCGAEMHVEMMAAKDARTCWRRSKISNSLSSTILCDPIGDQNVYLSVSERNKSNIANDSVVLLATRLDSLSMFYGRSPGAGSYVSSIVTLLAAAEALGSVRAQLESANKSLLVVFFQGESFDYIGSSRMAKDMAEKKWSGPFNIDHLSEIIEVGDLTPTPEAFLHREPLSSAAPNVSAKVTAMETDFLSSGVDVRKASGGKGLPPSSIHSFLRHRSLPSLLFSSYDTRFSNRHYFSLYDSAEAIDASQALNDSTSTPGALNLTERASLLASAVYKRVTGKSVQLTANASTVTELLHCYLRSASCELHLQVAKDESELKDFGAATIPFDSYTGVWHEPDLNNGHSNRILVGRLLTYFLGEIVTNISKADCLAAKDKVTTYAWFVGPKNASGYRDQGRCVRSEMGLSPAKSAVFDGKPESYKGWDTHDEATWVESQWNGNLDQLTVFLLPNPFWEIAVLVSGVLILLLSALIAYFVNRRAKFIFTTANTYGHTDSSTDAL